MTDSSAFDSLSIRPSLLLMTGSILVFMTFMRFGIAALGWIVFAPFLIYLQYNFSLKQHFIFLLTLIVVYVLTLAKIVTSEVPFFIAPMFGISTGLICFITLSLSALVFRRLGVRWGIYTFASLSVVMGWIQYTLTPGASWGILAHTQYDNLPLIQLTALTGLGGITFVVAMGSALAAAAWINGFKKISTDFYIFIALLLIALVYGQLRLSSPAPGQSVLIGGVVTPVTHNEFPKALENVDYLRSFDDELFSRSSSAVARGAKVVLWNEIATLVSVKDEDTLVARGEKFAQQQGVLFMMAYGVVESVDPFHFVNKYRIYLPNGSMADEYIKRFPVPGDPNTAGKNHAKVVDFIGVKYSGAICYDYSYPIIGWDLANDGAEVALVPASDWRGIDPLHGRMARMNSVAVGLPLIRPVRAATSIATDQYGRLLGTLRYYDNNDGIMVVAVPATRVPTLYSATGEIFPLFALLFCFLVTIQLIRMCR